MQVLRTLTSNPIALRTFSSVGFLVFGDKTSGDAYIYKFNT